MQRSAMRELAFKFLYGIEIQKNVESDALELFFENNEIDEKDVQEYLTKIN